MIVTNLDRKTNSIIVSLMSLSAGASREHRFFDKTESRPNGAASSPSAIKHSATKPRWVALQIS